MSEKNQKDSDGSPKDKNYRVSNSSLTEDDMADVEQYSSAVNVIDVKEVDEKDISSNSKQNVAPESSKEMLQINVPPPACQECLSTNEAVHSSPPPKGCCTIS